MCVRACVWREAGGGGSGLLGRADGRESSLVPAFPEKRFSLFEHTYFICPPQTHLLGLEQWSATCVPEPPKPWSEWRRRPLEIARITVNIFWVVLYPNITFTVPLKIKLLISTFSVSRASPFD